jgi:internalin A
MGKSTSISAEDAAREWINKVYVNRTEKLDLRGLGLLSLPKEIGNLTHLTWLSISENSLQRLPQEIENLKNLETLYAYNNKLTTFPLEFCKLPNLSQIYINANLIQFLPQEIKFLERLRFFDISNNALSTLPTEICELRNLVSLNISKNKIASLPVSLKKMRELKLLDLKENPLSIPPEILERAREPQVIFDYYFSYTKKALNECKVLVVGQGSVGKTSLIHRLLENKYNPGENKTEGIIITQWKIENSNTGKQEAESQINLNIWDFGGQEIMHATHQFFLTKRSLYLLILDSRLTQEENRVEYWLKMIQSFGGDSPVLVVGNKTDQHPLDIDRAGLQKKYPNIVGVFETSAATGTGMEKLHTAIAEQTHALPHVKDLLPGSWFVVKSQLEELRRSKNFIQQDEFLLLCSQNKVGEESSQRTLIGFMHDLGVVLHFQDDPRLEALGILNPQWVTNGVYKILNSHELFQSKGVLTVSMLNEILNLLEYPRDKRLFIVDMMKKFELCYDITDATFLVPDLLPKDEPFTGEWEGALAFQYHYAVLPSSIITRFIVRMNTAIDEIVWRSGVVLKDNSNNALVKADTEDRKVYIWVGGDEHKRHDFLSKIRGQFDAIHKTISKLEVKEMVPVPGLPEAEPVDYDLLLQMDHNNVDVYPVLSGGKMTVVKVREMLSGIARQEDRQRGNITNVYVGGNVGGSLIVGDENQENRS